MKVKDRLASLWDETKFPSFGTFGTSENFDVLVFGCGIAGLSTALELSKQNLKVAIVDGAKIISGQTSRTTAHLSEVMEDRYARLVKLHSKNNLKLITKGHREAINKIEQTVCEENIDCSFKRIDSYVFLAPEDEKDNLEYEIQCMKECDLDARKINEIPLLNYIIPGVYIPFQAQFQPTAYMKGLVK